MVIGKMMSPKGYTLAELLVVMVLLAAFAGIAASFVVRRDTSPSAHAAVLNLASCLRRARLAAIIGNTQRVTVIDLNGRRFNCPDGEGRFPPASQILFRTAASEYIRESTASLRFFADGSASGGGIFLKDRGQIWSIRVNWLTGNIQVSREASWPEPLEDPEF